jgi:hypothetical protein
MHFRPVPTSRSSARDRHDPMCSGRARTRKRGPGARATHPRTNLTGAELPPCAQLLLDILTGNSAPSIRANKAEGPGRLSRILSVTINSITLRLPPWL